MDPDTDDEVGQYPRSGLFLFYSRDEKLQGLAVDGLRGPQVLAEGVPLTGRVPSEVERWMTARAAERFPEDDNAGLITWSHAR
ncbi:MULTISPECIES: hypothetical protein [Streptomyces]|uniref:hypothetical protein n=1 Tax=Streptomyces TaxID=1883 RepID=UPI000F7696E6|nr:MULTISPECIES: hypothetical protein [Streptomyces]RST08728.1 hypothetical protein EF910_00305 [Streptomyces sp. WAC07149]GLX19832.1 hypothetical protein Slala01_34760 [Streptomyces lavendulae subsp. lavendulae]GLX27328.1 hypothetical protein Slala02_31480 [Streptomyces lavendulae subsp. lavendulae]